MPVAALAPLDGELVLAELAVDGLYLLHFEPAYEHAAHYLGWSIAIGDRVAKHLRGAGSPLVAAAIAAGSTVTVARVWPGATRTDEARLKRAHHRRRLCPLCTARPRQGVA